MEKIQLENLSGKVTVNNLGVTGISLHPSFMPCVSEAEFSETVYADCTRAMATTAFLWVNMTVRRYYLFCKGPNMSPESRQKAVADAYNVLLGLRINSISISQKIKIP